MPRRFPVARDHPMGAMRVLVLSSDYGYVALVGAASAMMTYWQVSQVVHKRHKAGVAYPKMYEEGANEFNCAQRGHQNTLENYPQFLITLFLGGLEYPRVSASLGVLWILGRIGFMLGYCSGEIRNRRWGFMVSSLSQMGLLFLSISTGVRIVRGA